MNSDPPSSHRYIRQSLFKPLGEAGDRLLRSRRALIVGCGALGSHLAEHLARAGVGALRLVDRDVVEWSNLHRQTGYTEEDARSGRPKAIALADHLRKASSVCRMEPQVREFNASTALQMAEGCDAILDGSDNLPARCLINETALVRGIPWVYGGAIGDEAHAMLLYPGAHLRNASGEPDSPCLRCLLPEIPGAGELPTCDTAGVIGPAAGAAASIQAALALQCLASPPTAARQAGRWMRLRLWDLRASLTTVVRDPDCPACGRGELEYLDGSGGSGAYLLCGRNAVHVVPERPASGPASTSGPGSTSGPALLNLGRLAERLRGAGTVQLNEAMLRFTPSDHPATLTIFSDGRAIIERVQDIGLARALYDRFVGE